jgi:putative FmdB family regulatory protein|tara:strand:- start:23 stop:298 length:276 start_codon:yes stop_codon:yes gene_type:complete
VPFYSYECDKCKKEVEFQHPYGKWKKKCKCGGKLTKLLSAPRVARMTNPAMGRFCPETQFRDWCKEPLTPEKEIQGKQGFKLKPKKRKELI